VQPGATAVVVDEWPLVRLGIVQALRAAGVRVVAEADKGEDGVRLAAAERATYLVLGSVRDAPLADLVKRANAADDALRHVVVLVDQTSGEQLAAILACGVDGLLQRSLQPEDLVDALVRLGRGERVVAPGLVPLLVGNVDPGGSGGPAPVDGLLTRKELEVLARLSRGESNREIADALFVTPATVKTHLAHIYAKLGVTGRQEALGKAMALRLLG
jgi:DNA-binding NarL/FixJ family response regulator